MNFGADLVSVIVTKGFSFVWRVAAETWWLVLFVFFLTFLSAAIKYAQHIEWRKLGLVDRSRPSPEVWVKRSTNLFRDLGFRIVHQPRSYGSLVTVLVAMNGKLVAVHPVYGKRKIDRDTVRSILNLPVHPDCVARIIVTNSLFTYGAKHEANTRSVFLWDRHTFASKIRVAEHLQQMLPPEERLTLRSVTISEVQPVSLN